MKNDNWNKKYENRDTMLRNPENFIVENYNNLTEGSVLDFASGDGRNSIFLAEKGFNVTSVDFSSEALKRLSLFASHKNLKINIECMDLTKPLHISSLGMFNNIIIIRYKAEDHLIKVIEDILNPNGTLIYCTFNINQHKEKGFDKSFCLEPRELQNKFSLSLLKYESFNSSDNYVDAYIFKKK